MLENKTQFIDYLDLILEGIANNGIEIFTDAENELRETANKNFTQNFIFTTPGAPTHEQRQAEYSYNEVIVREQDCSFKAGFRVAVQLLLGSQQK